MKILGIGESVIDIASHNGKELTKDIGGPVPIALIFLARMGVSCTLLTTVGNDTNGAHITQRLESEGVSLMIQEANQTKVNHYVINPIDGSRKKQRGTTIHQHIENIDEAFLKTFDLIIIDRHEKKAFYEVITKKKSSAKLIIDPSTEASSFTKEMIAHADYPIIPLEGVLALGKDQSFSDCLQKLHTITKQPVIITAGSLGSIISTGKKKELIPSIHIRALDVQGAGDVYRGAFAYGLTQEWDLATCCRFANKVAALHCTKFGNGKAIPQKEEIATIDHLLIRENFAKLTFSEL